MDYLKGFLKFMMGSLFASSVLTLSVTVFAEELHKIDAQAMDKTVQFLKSKSEREQYIKDNPDAQKADGAVKQILGDGADTDSAYAAAAAIFRQLATDSNGDFSEMMKKMGEAQSNPEAFYKSLSPEHKAMIKGLAEKAEARKQQPHPQNH